ncbi:hypothetical protein GCK32_011032 [Trichostrongylus colubriformis]|uniref:Uncharacterized protein n=1 Tax=Trichostrongylus colubriformis TaxID=6319 RepID=A0AAN8FZT8_TRICO
MYGEGITAASTGPAEQPQEESTLGKEGVIEDATLSVGDHDASMGAQYRREKRYEKLNEIMNAYATVEVEARALARIDANESLEKLEKILEHIKLAASVAPEMTTSELPRGKLKKPKDSTGEDLHEEIRKMRQQSQEDAL